MGIVAFKGKWVWGTACRQRELVGRGDGGLSEENLEWDPGTGALRNGQRTVERENG
jgi:hypothetical protein